MIDPWRKESLNLKVGDFIIWQDVQFENVKLMVDERMKWERAT